LHVGINEPSENEIRKAYHLKASSFHPVKAGAEWHYTFEDLTYARDLLTGKVHPSQHRNIGSGKHSSFNRRKQFPGDSDPLAMKSIFGSVIQNSGDKENPVATNISINKLNQLPGTDGRDLIQTSTQCHGNVGRNAESSVVTENNAGRYVRKSALFCRKPSFFSADCGDSASTNDNRPSGNHGQIDRSLLWQTTAQRQMRQTTSTTARNASALAVAAQQKNRQDRAQEAMAMESLLMPARHGRRSSMAKVGAAMMMANSQGLTVHGGVSRLAF
jgi:hypothetical protein